MQERQTRFLATWEDHAKLRVVLVVGFRLQKESYV